eukprot:765363-Hanusia_phi.AAC.2
MQSTRLASHDMCVHYTCDCSLEEGAAKIGANRCTWRAWTNLEALTGIGTSQRHTGIEYPTLDHEYP